MNFPALGIFGVGTRNIPPVLPLSAVHLVSANHLRVCGLTVAICSPWLLMLVACSIVAHLSFCTPLLWVLQLTAPLCDMYSVFLTTWAHLCIGMVFYAFSMELRV